MHVNVCLEPLRVEASQGWSLWLKHMMAAISTELIDSLNADQSERERNADHARGMGKRERA